MSPVSNSREESDFESKAACPNPGPWRPFLSELEVQQQEIEHDRQVLRLKLADVEAELVRLTSQQAELQKLTVSIDRLLKYFREKLEREDTPDSHSPTDLADSSVSDTP